MEFEQLGMDLNIPTNEIEDVTLDLDYNPEEGNEDDGYDWIDSVEDFYGDFENDPN